MYDIVTVGEILTEILAENKNQKFSEVGGTLLGGFPSGAPAIFIDQCAKMGAKTAIIAKVGSDDFGTMNLNRLKDDGVDISGVKVTKDNVTGTAFVTYQSNGERSFIFHFATAACGELCEDDVKESFIVNSKYLHIMGCSITGSPSMCKAITKAVKIAKENNVKISFDPNIRPELLKGSVLTVFKEILDNCDLLLSGKKELEELFENVPFSLYKMLRKNKQRIIVIKDGSNCTLVYTRKKSFKISTFPTIEVDATGAGDSFDGTFLTMLSNNESLEQATLYGNASGALAVSKKGPMEGNAHRDTIEELIRNNPNIKPIIIPALR
ncbi:MAG: sugar kinase [Sphaerochaetaceae bacterium]